MKQQNLRQNLSMSLCDQCKKEQKICVKVGLTYKISIMISQFIQKMNFAKFDPHEYNQHFANNSQEIRQGPLPTEKRTCNDICCLVTFILIILLTIVLGAIMINDGKDFYKSIYSGSGTKTDMSGLASVFSTQGGIIVGMFFLSLVLAVAFMFLLKAFPKCMVYSMIGLIYLVFIALIILGIVNGIWWMVISFAVGLLLISCMLYCFRRQLQTGIMLLKVAATFLSEKPTVYIAPLYPLAFAILFFVFWIAAIVAELYYLSLKSELAKTDSTVSTSKENAFIVVWVIIFIFMITFFSYVQTYLIATCCSFWYYGIQDNYCFRGALNMNRFHLGSITFGALVITVLTVLRRLANQQSNNQRSEGNIVASVCLCLVACCLSCIQNLVQTLNHNAFIVMTVTGESYIDSAKTALSIIFQNFGLFSIVDFISGLVTFFGILLAVGVPTLTGFLIIRYGRSADEYTSSYGAVAIFFLSIIIAGLIISMVSEALSCVFIFYCFDKKFRSMGISVANSPPAIRQFLDYEGMTVNPSPYVQQGAPRTDEQLRDRGNF